MVFRIIFAAVCVAFFTASARADTDSLLPITFVSVRADIKKSLAKMAI